MTPNWTSADDLSRAFAKRTLDPLDVLEVCIAQAERLEPQQNALTLIAHDNVREQARASNARWAAGNPLSPLDGVPVLVKDLILTRGQSCLRGSWTVDAAGPWEDDGPSVARLREAGAVLMARTTTPEIGWKGVTDSPRHGITRNPWNPGMTAGGSSGGASAAVAAGYAPLALGTDGGGSIRIPASFSGIFGLKPSFGRVPAFPLSPFGTVAHVGPMTRTVRDAALMMEVISRPDARDWHSLPHDPASWTDRLGHDLKGKRIAFSADLGHAFVDSEVAAATRHAVALLAGLGAEIVETNPGFADPVETFRILWWSGAHAALGHLPKAQQSRLDPGLQRVLDEARSFTLDDYLAAQKARGALGNQMRVFMEGFDALVTPTMPIPAFDAGVLAPPGVDPRLAWLPWTPFTYPFNLTQQPAASLNVGFTTSCLPIGLQIVGRMFDDRGVLAIAAALEAALGLTDQKPVLAL